MEMNCERIGSSFSVRLRCFYIDQKRDSAILDNVVPFPYLYSLQIPLIPVYVRFIHVPCDTRARRRGRGVTPVQEAWCRGHRQGAAPGSFGWKGYMDESNIHRNERDLETV
ncbi:hypothetical protein LR48_Vigan09g048400 [Vigna angularis]|uniref:Uncharacterized protein n=1 Tax=Phaseolus angularis TaxID=3914 RepID=A0A0L9V9Q1_PHAAN|nr:hypothetical protein LR48_Vigan09g048400 [Vigna angularis]